MSDAIGSVARVLEVLARWWMSEDGYQEWSKRRALARQKAECLAALRAHDWDRLRQCVDELRRLADAP